MTHVDVRYKCACMAEEAAIDVPGRRDDELIETWMDVMGAALMLDHRRRSPLCMAKAMQYAKIYVPPHAVMIGQGLTKQ